MERRLHTEPVNAPLALTQPVVAQPISHEKLFEVWPVFQRHWPLILTVFLTSLALGAVHFLKMPPTYESTAQILLESKRPPVITVESYSSDGEQQKTIETHSFIIGSHLIIGKAVKAMGAEVPATLREKEDVIKHIQENLTVNVMGDDTTIVTIHYVGEHPDETKKVVAALVDEYKQFLGRSSQSIGEETTRLITQAKDELLKRLEDNEFDYAEFRKTAPLLWEDGKGINPHQARQLEMEAARSQLLVERSALVGKIKTLASAAAMGGNVLEALRFEARRELLRDIAGLSVLEPGDEINRETAKQLVQEYTSLQTERDQLLDQFGRGHPDIAAMKSRLGRLKKQMLALKSMRSSSSSSVDQQLAGSDYVTVYLESLQEDLRTINQQLTELNGVFDREQVAALELQNYTVQDESLRRDNERTQMLFDAVVGRLQEIDIVREHTGNTMSMLSAPAAGEQIQPTLPSSLAAAGFLGLMLGFGIATIVDRTAATFRGPAEMRQVLGVPVVGRIPQFRKNDLIAMADCPDVSPTVCAAHRNGSNITEAYGSIRTSLFFGNSGKTHRVIQVTSPIPGDGKSTLTANMAVTLAKSGKRVLVVDADFRRPTQHKLFGMSDKMNGLSDVVTGAVPFEEGVRESNVPGVYIMSAGTRLDNPSELLVSHGFEMLLKVAVEEHEYDFVLVDTPPILAVTDPVAVAARVDAVILAIRLRRGVKIASKRATEMLANVGANVIGIVVNAVNPGSKFGKQVYGGYEYGYGYGYGNGHSNGHDSSTQEMAKADSTRRLEYVGGPRASKN